jgi:hypothetical protein
VKTSLALFAVALLALCAVTGPGSVTVARAGFLQIQAKPTPVQYASGRYGTNTVTTLFAIATETGTKITDEKTNCITLR